MREYPIRSLRAIAFFFAWCIIDIVGGRGENARFFFSAVIILPEDYDLWRASTIGEKTAVFRCGHIDSRRGDIIGDGDPYRQCVQKRCALFRADLLGDGP